MSSPSVEQRVGLQSPRVLSVPPYVSSAGDEAVELAARAGLDLDPWQQLVLRESLGEKQDGRWAAKEVGLVVPRQNGKGSILEARELAGLFLFGEKLLVHSAHEQRTSGEHFLRMIELIEESEFSSRLKGKPKRGKGSESIELKSGQRIMFVTRTSGGGRGLTGDLIVLDEAMILAQSTMKALVPTLSGRSMFGNPQLWYTGSAVDQDEHEHGLTFSRVRRRGWSGKDSRLAFFEWSANCDHPDLLTEAMASDPDEWGAGNPALGYRISEEHIEGERDTLSARGFAVERMGVGDWPDPDADAESVIKPAEWAALADGRSEITGPVSIAFDVAPDRAHATAAVAGRRADGRAHVEVLERNAGTDWLVAAVAGYVERNGIETIVCDSAGPASSLVAELKRKGVFVQTLTAREYANACGEFFDAVKADNLRHLGTVELTSAVRGATTRTLGDAWAWSRRSSVVDISPLVACTLAFYGAANVDDVPFTFEILS